MDEAGELPAPDPESVTTVADLAYELRVLRVCSGKPSVRELSRRAATVEPGSLPHSTAQDALQGNRGLPRLSVVLALVRALGVTDTRPWEAAWTRAQLERDGLHERPHAAEVRRPAAGRRIASGTRIKAVNIGQGAALIQSLSLGDVVDQLADMQEADAAYRLNEVQADRAAAVLAEMDEVTAGRIVGSMRQSAAAAALDAMAPTSAAAVLQRIRFDRQSGVVSYLSTERFPSILACLPDTAGFVGQLNLSDDIMARFLAAMPFDEVARLLIANTTIRNKAPGWLSHLPSEQAAKVLTAVEAKQAAVWLDACTPEAFSAVVEKMTTAQLLPILAELQQAAGRMLKKLGEERLVQLLTHAPPPEISDWLGLLRGHLSSSSYSQLRESMRR